MSESVSVTVAGEEYTLDGFRGFKATEVGEVIATIMDAVPDILDKVATFSREYAANNGVRVTREMCTLPQFRRVFERMNYSDADWERSGGAVLLPQQPSNDVVMAAMFPYVYRQAREHVVRLLSYMLCTNAELREADENDSVRNLIKEKRTVLMHDCSVDEILALALASVRVLKTEFDPGKAQEVRDMWNSLITVKQEESQPSTTESAVDPQAPEVVAGEQS